MDRKIRKQIITIVSILSIFIVFLLLTQTIYAKNMEIRNGDLCWHTADTTKSAGAYSYETYGYNITIYQDGNYIGNVNFWKDFNGYAEIRIVDEWYEDGMSHVDWAIDYEYMSQWFDVDIYKGDIEIYANPINRVLNPDGEVVIDNLRTQQEVYDGFVYACGSGWWIPDDEYNIYASWSSYYLSIEHDEGIASVSGGGWYDKGATATTTATAKTGYHFAYYEDLDYNQNWYNATDTWGMHMNRSIYAHSSPNSYTLTLNPNGGSVKTDKVTLTYDTSDYYEMSWNIPTRTGYTFEGWYTSANGGKKVYDASGYVTNEGTYWRDNKCVYAGNYTLYAHWKHNDIFVNYYANGGTGNNYFTNYNASLSTNKYDSNKFNKVSYIFAGYSQDSDGAVQHQPGDSIYTMSGITTIRNASNSNMCIDITNYGKDNGSNIWTSNYHGGWNQQWVFVYEKTENGVPYWSIRNPETGRVLDVDGMVGKNGANVHLYQWNSTDNQLWTIEIPENGTDQFVYIKSKLGSYYLELDGSVANEQTNVQIWEKDGGRDQLWRAWDATVNCYAKWTLAATNVTFDGNGGTFTWNGTIGQFLASTDIQQGSTEYKDISSMKPVKAGYRFAGWEVADGIYKGDLVWRSSGKFYPYSANRYFTSTGAWNYTKSSLTVQARWYTTYDATISLGEGTGKGAEFVGMDYIFDEIATGSEYYNGTDKYNDITEIYDEGNSSVNIWAEWDNHKLIGFKVTGCSPDEFWFDTDNIGGYLLDSKGYYYFKEGDIPDADDSKYFWFEHPASSIVIELLWESTNSTLTYDGNGGTASKESQTVSTGSPWGELATAEKTGYTFSGWWTSKTGGTQITAESIANGNLTVYAHWLPNTGTKYTVNHYQQNIDDDDFTLKEMETLTGTTEESVTPETKDYTGFTSPEKQTVTIKADGSTTVNYYYTRNIYTVTLNIGTGIDSVSGSGLYKYGATVTIDASMTAGYQWYEWKGTYDTDTQTYTFTMPAYNVSNTANAILITYTISYEMNGGNATNPTSYNVNTETFTLNNPTKEGYKFIGWTGSNGTTPQTVVSIFKGSTGDRYYIANWESDQYEIRFDANGGTGTMNPITATFDVPVQLPSNTFIKTTSSGNSTFLYWEDRENNKTYADMETVINLTTDSSITLYAIWDDTPVIEAQTRYFTLLDAQNGKITHAELLSTIMTSDDIDKDIWEKVTVKYYDSEEWKQFTSDGASDIIYTVTDSAGNTAEVICKVYITDTSAKKVIKNTYVRSISPKYYQESPENGGLELNSIWRTNPEYAAVLNSAMENRESLQFEKIDRTYLGIRLQKDVPGSISRNHAYETWHLTSENVAQIKEYINVHGIGNLKEPDALKNFREQFSNCISK